MIYFVQEIRKIYSFRKSASGEQKADGSLPHQMAIMDLYLRGITLLWTCKKDRRGDLVSEKREQGWLFGEKSDGYVMKADIKKYETIQQIPSVCVGGDYIF